MPQTHVVISLLIGREAGMILVSKTHTEFVCSDESGRNTFFSFLKRVGRPRGVGGGGVF